MWIVIFAEQLGEQNSYSCLLSHTESGFNVDIEY